MRLLARWLIFTILLMCVAPAFGCDDCRCNPFHQTLTEDDADHSDCGNCACSPFVTCTHCAGFVVSEHAACRIEADVAEVDRAFFLFAWMLLTETHRTHVSAERKEAVFWEQIVAKSQRLRGSPLFS